MVDSHQISGTNISSSSKHVLIIEDEQVVRNSICLVLSEEGYICTSARSGTEAIQLAEQCSLDLIIVDYRLPGLNGIQTFRKIKHLHPEIQVLFITCYSESDAISKALNAGAQYYLLKPLDFDELLNLVASMLH